ncbi:MAG: serine protease [Phycisphaerae bacterium]|jgi:S1-C subfamily serine protease
MGLSDTYEKVKPSIVAFTSKYSVFTNPEDLNEKNLSFPPIIGTGFIINKNGIIVTNDHVAEEIKKPCALPCAKKGECAYQATIFKITEEYLVQAPLEILEIYQPEKLKTKGLYYGPNKPDIAIVLVKARDLPALELDTSELREGVEVATAGFPMGKDLLTAPGYLHQITPTLQKGIISAVLPFQGAIPHAYAVNIMVQGGASGSPVFLPESGTVIGIIDSSLIDSVESIQKDTYQIPTNISYATPSYHISNFLKEVEGNYSFKLPQDTKTFDDLIANTEKKIVRPHQPYPNCKIIKMEIRNRPCPPAL